MADTLFYAATTFAAWRLDPDAITSRAVPLAALAILEVARYVLDAAKFGREASYHMWSSKLWGIALFLAFFWLLALGRDTVLISVAMFTGIVADLEGLAISLALREPRTDVPSLLHAIRSRGAIGGKERGSRP